MRLAIGTGWHVLGALALAGFAAAAPALAASKSYKCIDPVTKRVTVSQFACEGPAGPTMAELAASAAAAREKVIQDEARVRAARDDKQLMNRYPVEAAHRYAHVADLRDVVRKLRAAEDRFAELMVERKPIEVEMGFYRIKAPPPELKGRVDRSDASFLALRDVFVGLRLEIEDVDARYRLERVRLTRLWDGSAPGSMGLLAPAPAASAASASSLAPAASAASVAR
ncbi:MAG: hypothetical protein ABI699_00615 [Caldimonas sp.]